MVDEPDVDESPLTRDRELAHLLLSETREEILKADHKAALLLSALGAMVIALITTATGDAAPQDYSPAAQFLFWTGCAAWAPALIASGMALLPRTGTPHHGRAHYYGDIARTTSLTLLSRAVRDTDPLDRDVDQLATLSRVVAAKYRCIRHGMAWSALFCVHAPLGVLIGSFD